MNSRALAVARNDLADAARSKLLWGAAILLLVVSVPGYLSITSALLERPVQGVRYFPGTVVNYVAPVALVVGHRAVVGERESGRLRLLFGHPVTRWDVVAGKFLGRATLIAGVLSLTCLGLGVATVVHYGTLPPLLFLAMLAYILCYGVVWVGAVVGISAAASTRLQSLTGGLGLFMVFGPFQIWEELLLPLFTVLFTGSTSLSGIDPLEPSSWPLWYEYVLRLNPMENFVQTRFGVAALVDSEQGLGDPQLFLFGVVVLLLWGTVPLGIGYWRFEAADVG